MGYRYLALNTSETTHQIPISEFEQAEKDYRKILGEIEMFLDPDWTENMPPVYSKVLTSFFLMFYSLETFCDD